MSDDENREVWLARTLVGLADTLTAGFDVAEFLSGLTARLRELIGDAEVGLILADDEGGLRVAGSSSDRLRLLELFELHHGEGPCLDCYRTGEPVVNARLDDPGRWPLFAPSAAAAGFRMAHALPMRLRGTVIGAVNTLSCSDRPLGEVEVALGQALADMATIAILQHRAAERAAELADRLEGALSSRAVIEQARGQVSARLNVDVDGALALLREHAHRHRRRLSEVARDVVAGRLGAEELPAG